MLNIAICDDEECYLNELSNLINENTLNDIQYTLNTYESGEKLLNGIEKDKVDILFLDIEMNGIYGIETGKIIKQKNPNCIIFFVTSHNNYITDIFRLDSFQFLQKPINHEDFKYDYDRAITKYKNDHIYLEVKVNGRTRNILLGEIKFIEVTSREIKIHLKNEVVIHNGKFSLYEEKLKAFNFSKTHKSYLVNLTQIEAIENDRVYLRGIGDYIPISRNYKNDFLNEYHKYKIGRCL